MNVYDVLIKLGYSPVEKGTNFRCLPIYRSSDNPTSLSVDKETGNFYDFGTDQKGTLFDLITITLGYRSRSEAEKWAKDNLDFSPEQVKKKISYPERKRYPLSCIDRLVHDHSFYLNRGIDSTILDQFKCGIAAKGDFRNRIVFPIFDSECKHIDGFCGRDVSNKSTLKWLIRGQKDSFKYPLFLNRNDILKARSVFLVESIGDCLSLFNAGTRNVMVLFGLKLIKGVFTSLIALNPDKIYICLNNDSSNNFAGNNAAKSILYSLRKFFPEESVEVHLPPKNDLGEMSKKEVIRFVEKVEKIS